jgi:hypothetical protein
MKVDPDDDIVSETVCRKPTAEELDIGREIMSIINGATKPACAHKAVYVTNITPENIIQGKCLNCNVEVEADYRTTSAKLQWKPRPSQPE